MECDPGGGGEGGGSELKFVVNRLIDMDRKVLIQRVCRRLRYNGLSVMLVLGVVVMGLIGGGGCFVVSEGGSSSTTPTPSPSVATAFPVLVGDFSISPVNKTEEDSSKENVEVNKKPPITVTNLIGNASLEDLGVTGGVSSTTPKTQRDSEKGEEEKEDGNCTKGHEHVDHSENKIEQILWDIFVEEGE